MKTTILFLAADPSDASRLRLGQEHREILEILKLSGNREQFLLEERLSVRPGDVIQAIFDTSPNIVHFSAHGMSTGELCLENAIGKIEPIQPDALAALFSLVTDQVKCVVLNACYSKIQVDAIAEHIDYVIGMKTAVNDQAAIVFSIGFYRALGAGRHFEKAYEHAIAELRLMNLPDYTTPILDGRKFRQKQNKQIYLTEREVQNSQKHIAIVVHFQELLRQTIERSSIQDIVSIGYGISHKTINRIDILGLNTKDECKAQVTLKIDWDSYQQELGEEVISINKHNSNGLAIEVDEAILLFNRFVKDYSLFAVWNINNSDNLISNRWGNTEKASVCYKIPEIPELSIHITLSEEVS